MNGKTRAELRRVFANPNTRQSLLQLPAKHNPPYKKRTMRALRETPNRVIVTNGENTVFCDKTSVEGEGLIAPPDWQWPQYYQLPSVTGNIASARPESLLEALMAITGNDVVFDNGDGIYRHVYSPYAPNSDSDKRPGGAGRSARKRHRGSTWSSIALDEAATLH